MSIDRRQDERWVGASGQQAQASGNRGRRKRVDGQRRRAAATDKFLQKHARSGRVALE
jgi:hypothetical protein